MILKFITRSDGRRRAAVRGGAVAGMHGEDKLGGEAARAEDAYVEPAELEVLVEVVDRDFVVAKALYMCVYVCIYRYR